jgi:hypothetical protein
MAANNPQLLTGALRKLLEKTFRQTLATVVKRANKKGISLGNPCVKALFRTDLEAKLATHNIRVDSSVDSVCFLDWLGSQIELGVFSGLALVSDRAGCVSARTIALESHGL